MTEKQISDIVEKLQTHYVVFYTKQKKIQLQDHKHRVKHQFDIWQHVSEFAKTLPQPNVRKRRIFDALPKI